MCILYNFSSIKARFSHSSTVIRLHSCSGKKYADDLRASCFYKEINIFEHFLKQDIQQKIIVFIQCSPGSMPPTLQHASRYAILLYSYKRRNFKMFFKTNLYQNIAEYSRYAILLYSYKRRNFKMFFKTNLYQNIH